MKPVLRDSWTKFPTSVRSAWNRCGRPIFVPSCVEQLWQANIRPIFVEPLWQANIRPIFVEPLWQANIRPIFVEPLWQANIRPICVEPPRYSQQLVKRIRFWE
jgi:hypothetical protein